MGPEREGQPKNQFLSIVADPGPKSVEAVNLGLFYTLMGRGTTVGDENDNLSSSIYFDGTEMTPYRVMDLLTGIKGPLTHAQKRQQWTSFLDWHNHTFTTTDDIKSNVRSWLKVRHDNSSLLNDTIAYHSARQKGTDITE